MKCTNCNQEFNFGWRIYLRHSSHFNRFITPCCNTKVTLAYKWYDHLYSVFLGVVAGAGIIFTLECNIHVALKFAIIASVLFVTGRLDKHLDNKLKVKVIGKGI